MGKLLGMGLCAIDYTRKAGETSTMIHPCIGKFVSNKHLRLVLIDFSFLNRAKPDNNECCIALLDFTLKPETSSNDQRSCSSCAWTQVLNLATQNDSYCNSFGNKIALIQIDNVAPAPAPFSFRITPDLYLNTQELIDAVAAELRATDRSCKSLLYYLGIKKYIIMLFYHI